MVLQMEGMLSPNSGIGFVTDLESYIKNSTIKLASIIGRYYAMDRDNRWERIKVAYDALTGGIGDKNNSIIDAIEKLSYKNNITDEFIKPIIKVDVNSNPITTIKDEDIVIFFNFRTDRGRELTKALTQVDFPEFNMKKLKINYVTMTNYDDSFSNINVIFDKSNIKDTLGRNS